MAKTSLTIATASIYAGWAFSACAVQVGATLGTDSVETGKGNAPEADSTTTEEDGTFDTTVETQDSESSGWSPTQDGTVKVQDGGVVITEADGTQVVCYKTSCDGRVLECGDCKDNDSDGKTDWRDRECLGPCDNTEGPALISDVGGVTGSTCHVDCYFDFGNGMGTGSDDCWWDHQCDPLEPEAEICPYDERLVNNQKFCPEEQSERCGEVCIPFTPNGCDCFGCCTFPELEGKGAGGSEGYVWIGAKNDAGRGMCTFEDILDPAKCPPCTPIPNCINECGRCELCIGKSDLPADCFETDDPEDTDNVPDGMCDEGLTPCGLPGMAPCDPGFYCVTGCCRATGPIV